MFRKLLCIAVALMTGVLTLALSGNAEEGGPPPARKIPGITAEDMSPRGCVDCHIVRQDIGRDVRVSTIMKEWSQKVDPKFLARSQAAAPEGLTLSGKHPAGADKITDIPAGCLACHGKSSTTAPPFSRMMHLYHLTGDENPYLSFFQGECTGCHKLNQKTGQFLVPSGPEN